jgi:hypothetical protein
MICARSSLSNGHRITEPVAPEHPLIAALTGGRLIPGGVDERKGRRWVAVCWLAVVQVSLGAIRSALFPLRMEQCVAVGGFTTARLTRPPPDYA